MPTTTSYLPQQHSPNSPGGSLNGLSNLTPTSDRSSISKSQPQYVDTTPTASHGPSVKKIFIPRDYSHGDGVRFSSSFPNELDGILEKEHFDEIMSKINTLYANAEKVSPRSICESVAGCLTAYVIFLFIDTQYDRALKKVSKFIDQQNYTLNRSNGITLIDPMERGLRCMEIRIENAASSSYSSEIHNNDE